jgi:hypothetical protein
MKTSILISSVAALCLMITFAEAPIRLVNEKINSVSTGSFSYIPVTGSVTSPVIIATKTKKEARLSAPTASASDFSYLKFNVSEFIDSDKPVSYESEDLPAPTEADYSYLKFIASDFSSDSEEMKDLPESENTTNGKVSKEAATSEFEYLKFDVNSFTSSSTIDELPVAESQSEISSKTNLTGNEFNYLKFGTDKFSNSDQVNSIEQVELPVSE